MELSKRLSAVAGLVTEGVSVADIGTDHAYIPVYLAEQGRNQKIFAMDVNSGPLERAKAHIREHGLTDQIQTRLSDGLKALFPGEAELMIAAGMGGALTIQILQDAPEIAASICEFVLQPQSEIHKVRAYLNQNHYLLTEEEMVEEDGKYYPMMKLVHGEESEYSELELYYGRLLLRKKHPVLFRYLLREKKLKEELVQKLREQSGEAARVRRKELQHELERNQKALEAF